MIILCVIRGECITIFALCETCGELFDSVCHYHAHKMPAIPETQCNPVDSVPPTNCSSNTIMHAIYNDCHKHVGTVTPVNTTAAEQIVSSANTDEDAGGGITSVPT